MTDVNPPPKGAQDQDPHGGDSSGALKALQDQKALVEAQKALLDAQTQSTLARLVGDVKSAPYSGSVDMKNDKAGTEEAALLAARAVREAARAIAAVVAKLIEPNPRSVFVIASKDLPPFQRLLAFRIRKNLITQTFAAGEVRPLQGALEALPPAAVVAAGVDALSKMLGFFKTDSTIGGVDVKVDESLLLFAASGALAKQNCDVRLPLVYCPDAQSQAVQTLTHELAPLAALRGQAQGAIGQLDPAKEKARVEVLQAAIAAYDAFSFALLTPDATGVTPLALVAGELAIESALRGGVALLLKLDSSGGGYLVKKNLWTGLGGMPLFHTGGATVTYLLLDGVQGKVLAGDTIAVHGGFIPTDKIRDELRKET
jgi:hypothetical protein